MDLQNKNLSVVKNTEIVEFRSQCHIFRVWTLRNFEPFLVAEGFRGGGGGGVQDPSANSVMKLIADSD